MIINPNVPSSLRDRPVLQIKDSLLGDALERNKLKKTVKPGPTNLEEGSPDKPADLGEIRAL